MNVSFRFPWRWGRPAVLWVEYLDVVERMVKHNDLQAIPKEHLFSDDPIPLGHWVDVADKPVPRPYPFPGGLRIPHLHLGEDVYRLNPAQWREFSTTVIEDLRKKLEHVEIVSFEQAAELVEATAGLV